MHITAPGHWLGDDTLEVLSATELLMLREMLGRAARRRERMEDLHLVPMESQDGIVAELEALERWFLFELEIRLCVAQPATVFLTRIGFKNDPYWHEPIAP